MNTPEHEDANRTKDQVQLWQYVHGEMDEEDRTAFDVCLEHDRQLKEQLKLVREMDQQLRAVAPLLRDETYVERLEDHLIAAWEADRERSTGEQKSAGRSAGLRIPFPFMRSAAAVAAVLCIGLFAWGVMRSPLDWSVEQHAVMMRGGEEQSTAALDSETRQALEDFRREVIEKYRELRVADGASRFHWPRDWRLHMRVQPLHEGAYALEISAARRPDAVPLHRWELTVHSAVGARERLSLLADTMARQLAASMPQDD